MKKALVTGARGQTGSYLCEFLINTNKYKVDGLVRRSGNLKLDNLKSLLKNKEYKCFNILYGDFTDPYFVADVVKRGQYDEIYHAGAVSHVGYSFEHPSLNMEVNCTPIISFLENIKNFSPHTKFLLMSTSECWGNNYTMARSNINNLEGRYDGKLIKIQDETVPFKPCSPYGVSKAAASYMVDIYHKSYGIWASYQLCHNHESPRRGSDFLTKKVVEYIGRLYRGETKNKLELGNLSAVRDFSYAGDIVEGIYKAMQQDKPATYVFCSGEGHSIQEFVELAFKLAGYNWREHVIVSEKLFRPNEVNFLQGSYLKAKEELGWRPKIKFEQLVNMMVSSEISSNHSIPLTIIKKQNFPMGVTQKGDIVNVNDKGQIVHYNGYTYINPPPKQEAVNKLKEILETHVNGGTINLETPPNFLPPSDHNFTLSRKDLQEVARACSAYQTQGDYD